MYGDFIMTTRESKDLVSRWIEEGVFEEMLPEVAALREVPQPEIYHAEGDAFVHTMLAIDAVDDDDDPRVFWGVMLHDIGKASTTDFIDGRWRSLGHDRVGAELAPLVMIRLGMPELADDVAWLVRHHTFHFSWNLRPEDGLTRRQAAFVREPLFPLLLRVCSADAAGSWGGSSKGDVVRLIEDLIYDKDPLELSAREGRS